MQPLKILTIFDWLMGSISVGVFLQGIFTPCSEGNGQFLVQNQNGKGQQGSRKGRKDREQREGKISMFFTCIPQDS